MKKITYILRILLIILLFASKSFGQTTVTVSPTFPGGFGGIPSYTTNFTGRVNDNYNKNDDELWIGNPALAAPSRSWIVFNIDEIPTNATVISLDLYLHPYNAGGSNHTLVIKDFNSMPVNNFHGDLVWPDIGEGYIYYSGDDLAKISDQWVSISLNSNAVDYFNSHISNTYYGQRCWGVGLYENGDNDNNSQIHGYTSSSYMPRLDVTYTIPCNSPTNLNTSYLTDNSVYLDWDYVSGSSNYEVRYAPTTSPTWTYQYPTTNSYSVSELTCNTSYDWQVRTNCGNGNYSNWADGSIFTTSACPCNSPNSLSVSSINENSAYLNWNSVSGSIGFEVRYKSTTSSTWTYEYPTTNSYSVSGLVCGTTYDWEIRTNCGSGNYSDWVPGTDFTTSACACNFPSSLSASNITANSSYLNWNDVSGNSGYDLYYRELGTSVWYVKHPTSSEYLLSPLSSNTTYEYKVRTDCGDNNYSDWTITKTFTTEGETNLGIPTLLSPSNNSTVTVPFELQWQHGENATNSRIHIRVQGQSWEASDWLISNSYLVDDQIEIGSYEWYIESTDGTSYTTSEPWLFTVDEAISCQVPSGFALDGTGITTAYLTWSPVSGNNGYEIRYKDQDSTEWKSATTSTSSYNYQDLICGRPYDFQARTNCGNNNYSEWSSSFGFYTKQCEEGELDCSNAIELTSGEIYYGNTDYGVSNISDYGCNNWGEGGKETVHKITAISDGEAVFEYSESNVGDVDLFILSSCNPEDCIMAFWGSENLKDTLDVIAGETYYFVTDIYSGYGGDYSLKVTIPEASNILDCSNAIELVSGETYNGNTNSGVANVLTYGCNSYNEPGKEVVHKITATYDGNAKIEFSENADGIIDLFFLASCDNNNCINAFHGSPDASSVFVNFELEVLEGNTYYLVTDVYSGDGGEYSLKVTIPEAVQPVAAFSATPTDGTVPLTVQFTDESENATSWSWNFGDGNSSTQKDPSYTYSSAGSYSVTLIATNDYGDDTETKTDYINVDNTTSVSNPDNPNSIRIYPNPTKGTLTFESSFELNQIEIYDMLGRIVYQAKFKTEVDISNLNEGVYLLKLFDKEDKNILTQKIILNK